MLSILQSSTQVGISQTGIDRANRVGPNTEASGQKNSDAENKKDSQALIGRTPSTDISQLLNQVRQQKVEAKPRLELSLLQTESTTAAFNTFDAQTITKTNENVSTKPSDTIAITDAINPSEIASATANQPQVSVAESPNIETASSSVSAEPTAISSQIEINTSFTFEPYKVGEEQLPSYVYDDELNIDGAGREPTAIFLSDQG